MFSFFQEKPEASFTNKVEAWLYGLTNATDINRYQVHWFPSEMPTKEELDKWSKTFMMANASQTRYVFIPPNSINPKVVQAGIRDTSMGKFGRNIIRFCYPAVGKRSQSTYSRMVIDPTGYPNKNHQHVPLPSSVVASAGFLQRFCQILNDCIFYISIILTGHRLYKASKTKEGIIPETGLVLAEYAAAFVGGGIGASVGGMIGCIGGPVFAVCGAVGGGYFGAYYALQLIKTQEQCIRENSVYAAQRFKYEAENFMW